MGTVYYDREGNPRFHLICVADMAYRNMVPGEDIAPGDERKLFDGTWEPQAEFSGCKIAENTVTKWRRPLVKQF